MKNYFAYRVCDRCGKKHDATRDTCPSCGREFEFEEKKRFLNDVRVGWVKNLLFFLIGLLGFQGFGLLISSVAGTVYLGNWATAHPSASLEERTAALLDFSKTANYSMIVNGIAYAIVFLAMLIILNKDIKEYGRGFKGWKPYLAGLVGFFALIMVNVVWNFVIQAIRPSTGTNANQSTIVSLAISYPVLSILIFGVIGPICEEFTYRIGLFSLTKRLSRVAAYIITPLVFGFIHFGWGSIATGGDALIIELLNIPDYILAGVIFAFLYDRFGIGASTTAHVMNNLLSFIQILILHSQGKV